jgi:hypothetical protein
VHFVQIQEVGLGNGVPSEQSIKTALKHAIGSLYERLRNERIDFASVSEVYFRLDPSMNWMALEQELFLASGALRKLARSRFPKARLSLVFCSDYKHRLTDMNGASVLGADEELRKLREAELEKIVGDSGALYEGNKYHYFRLPSGQTSDFFLRTGNCLASREALHIFSYWALPSLRASNLIICDTWSISTLGMSLARLGERYSGEKYECQYLSKYLDDDLESAFEVEELLEQADDGSVTPLFLVSALSSGRSLKSYVDAYDVLFANEKPKILALYLLSQTLAPGLKQRVDLGVLCNLGPALLGRGLKGFTDDIDLENDQQIFTIDAETYFPRYFEAREHEFKVGKFTGSNEEFLRNSSKLKNGSEFTGSSKAFFEYYAGHDLFSVCRDGLSNTKLNLRRHHAFHIDVHRLVQTDEFFRRLKEKLVKLKLQPSHVVHLSKPADEAMTKALLQVFGENSGIRTIRMTSFQSISKRKDVLRVLDNPECRVLFVDAMYISGQSTAQDFQQGLRAGLAELGKAEHSAEISYLIGVLRPDLSSKISSEIKRMIHKCCPTRSGGILVEAVETVLLPNWDGKDCPWCGERKLHSLLLQRHIRKMSGQERAYIENRKELLTNCRKLGLRNSLFFRRYPNHKFVFGPTSLWFDWSKVETTGRNYSEADAMLAIASAMQYWRDNYRMLPPAQYLLDQQTCFSVNKYNDPFLRAAIWRSLKKQEVDTFLPDQYRKELLNRVFDLGVKPDDADELVLGWEAALLLGRFLPRIIGSKKFEEIDWQYLKWTALAT